MVLIGARPLTVLACWDALPGRFTGQRFRGHFCHGRPVLGVFGASFQRFGWNSGIIFVVDK
jgi:hypothetical protein